MDHWCAMHDPARAEERSRYAARGGKTAGRGRPSSATAELNHLKDLLYRLADDVERGDLSTSRGAIMVQAYNAVRGVLEVQRRVKELEELEARLEALEERRWAR